jgi:ferredoxin
VVVVTYGNRSYDDALLELKDIMTKRNFNVLAAAAFVCEHSYSKLVGENRPSPDDLIEYHEFGECISNIRDGGRELEIPGSRPYCVHNNLKPMCPEVGESCIKCGHCEKICPSGAISLKETIEIDKTKCLKCQSCVKKCPTKSLSFNGQLDNFTLWLETNCTERIENEIFIL